MIAVVNNRNTGRRRIQFLEGIVPVPEMGISKIGKRLHRTEETSGRLIDHVFDQCFNALVVLPAAIGYINCRQ